MRNAQKREVLDCISSLYQAHGEIEQAMRRGENSLVRNMLSQCQEFAISLGENIERLEGEGHVTVTYLEGYCETLFQIYREVDNYTNAGKICKKLHRYLLKVENSAKYEISARMEMVFFPYKATMWDSLESVYLAAKEDPDCDVYCVPIPYYERNVDGSFGRIHYEGLEYPEYVEITDWQSYLFEERKPDVIFIHNPYDEINYVTSVHPRFYSSNLKMYTDHLAYIPYYSTAGGMSENQRLCPAYMNADYIVIQSPQLRRYFDERIPNTKFLPFGSPKFDKVIRKCQNPPEPPKAWKERMEGKKVYFYNTSIQGMLDDTGRFLKKMKYVFTIFKGREDACLLWRPHPLLESTFDSMRKEYRPWYDLLKQEFLDEGIGILDETSDIENAIALSDAYIGDAGTSVTSLFGVAGKPLFLLNNAIDSLPEGDDWRGEKVRLQFDPWGKERYQVTVNNQLWFSEENDYHYKFYLNLECGYSGGGYYMRAVEIKDKIYVLPAAAQEILVIKDRKIRKIQLKNEEVSGRCFNGSYYNEKYIFLLPYRYPKLIRFNMETEEIRYVEGIQPFNVRQVEGEWRAGGRIIYGKEYIFASPEDSQFLFLDMETLKLRKAESCSVSNLGTAVMSYDGKNWEGLWLTPLNGMTLTYWNPKRGEVREYGCLPKEFRSVKMPQGIECNERPFGPVVVFDSHGKETILIVPQWGNMYLTLDRVTGEMKEWKPPIPIVRQGKNGYFRTSSMGSFVIAFSQIGEAECRFWYEPERRLYRINLETREYEEIEIEFDRKNLLEQEPGFAEDSEWIRYCLWESAFNSLKDFLDGNITGRPFSREKQLQAFSAVNANTEGTCGRQVYEFIRKSL